MFITPLFAALLALLFIYLSYGVVRIRFGQKISSGHGDLRSLERAIRAHGNFSEYVPITLILLWFVETLTMSRLMVLVLGSVFIIGRVLHVIGMMNPKKWLICRQIGILSTFAVITILSLHLIYFYFPVSL